MVASKSLGFPGKFSKNLYGPQQSYQKNKELFGTDDERIRY